MISYLPEDKEIYRIHLEKCCGATLRNEIPTCECGGMMTCIDSLPPAWNPIDKYECPYCGFVVEQNSHEVCPDWETMDDWQDNYWPADGLEALKAA